MKDSLKRSSNISQKYARSDHKQTRQYARSDKKKPLSFQDIILELQSYWSSRGCTILQPYDMEVGAATFHPASTLRVLGSKSWNVAFVQPSRRPTDSRYGRHPNRLQHYYQFQVILKPSPDDMQEAYLKSLEHIGIILKDHDIRFVEDDWKSPTLGAAGLGWEVWCNGMEVSQFTYMQQIGNIACRPVAGEITYGLERIAMYIQDVDHFQDIDWNGQTGDKALTYGDIYLTSEEQFSEYNNHYADTSFLLQEFQDVEKQALRLINNNLPLPAYDYCLKLSHIFNMICASSVVSVADREQYIVRIRNMVKQCCKKWLDLTGEADKGREDGS